MARLSINDLNDLSGVSDEELAELYKYFRGAHTNLFNRLNNWIDTYNKAMPHLRRIEGTGYDNDIIVYNISRELYYNGTQLLDSVDLFDEFTSEYSSILYKLRKSDDKIRPLQYILNKMKKDMINNISYCYGMFSEAYDRLNKEDTYEG